MTQPSFKQYPLLQFLPLNGATNRCSQYAAIMFILVRRPAPFAPQIACPVSVAPIAIVVALIHSRFIHVHSLNGGALLLEHESACCITLCNRRLTYVTMRQRTRDCASLISPCLKLRASLPVPCRRRFWQSETLVPPR